MKDIFHGERGILRKRKSITFLNFFSKFMNKFKNSLKFFSFFLSFYKINKTTQIYTNFALVLIFINKK